MITYTCDGGCKLISSVRRESAKYTPDGWIQIRNPAVLSEYADLCQECAARLLAAHFFGAKESVED